MAIYVERYRRPYERNGVRSRRPPLSRGPSASLDHLPDHDTTFARPVERTLTNSSTAILARRTYSKGQRIGLHRSGSAIIVLRGGRWTHLICTSREAYLSPRRWQLKQQFYSSITSSMVRAAKFAYAHDPRHRGSKDQNQLSGVEIII
jgi:hypothetical protein